MDNINEVFKNITKSVTAFKIIIYSRVFIGYYCKVSESKIICNLLRLYCICVFALCVGCLYSVWINTYNRYVAFIATEYILGVIFSMITSEEYFLEYCETIRIGDAIMNHGDIPIVANYVTFIFLVVMFFIVIFASIYYSFYSAGWLMTVFSTNIFTAPYLHHMLILIIMSSLHTRLRMLSKLLEKNTTSISIIDGNDYSQRVRAVRKCLINYDHLLDNIDRVGLHLNCLLTIALIYNFPQLTYYLYISMWNYLYEADSLELVLNHWNLIFAIFAMVPPGIIAELVIYEVDKIEKILTNALLRCSDESLCYELEMTREYVRQRPFAFMICGAIPLDGKLPVKITALCLTYTILAFQFALVH